MLTYQLQDRRFRIEKGTKLIFPNSAEIKVLLGPTIQFGVEKDIDKSEPIKSGKTYVKTVTKGKGARIIFDANNGRTAAISEKMLEPLDVTVESKDSIFKCNGNEITLKFECQTINELADVVSSLHYGIPMILNIEFADPPFVIRTSGRVGEVEFNWEITKGQFDFYVTDQEKQKISIYDTFKRFGFFSNSTNRRLLAALHYFHVACRLFVSGNSPWEFMAETVLNYCKTLQILFGETRDKVRDGLRNIGYGNSEIERFFIPVMILRSFFDVGHPSVVLLKPAQLQVLYRYLETVNEKFRELIKHIFSKIDDGNYSTIPHEGLLPDKEKQKEIDVFINSIKKSNSW